MKASSTAARKAWSRRSPSSQGLFARRRIEISEPLDDFFFTQDYRNLIGAARDGRRGVVVNLNVGREIAELPLDGMPHLGSGISWERNGRRVMATPASERGQDFGYRHRNLGADRDDPDPGPRLFFLRSHENSKYFWSGVFFGPHKDLMNVIDKDTLEIVRTLRPVPGGDGGACGVRPRRVACLRVGLGRRWRGHRL
ncbi:cytochrome D1 domain-containing protein [Jhaorihella thermophila]